MPSFEHDRALPSQSETGIYLPYCRRLGGGHFGFRNGCFRHGPDGLLVWGAQDSAFSDDGSDVSCGSDVEGRVFDGYAVWGHLFAIGVGDLGGGALLDGDAFSGGGLKVEGGPWGGDVKGDAVFF